MKKGYRIGICLVLTVCLLLLSACAGGQAPHTDDPAQSTGQNEDKKENTGTQDTGTGKLSQSEAVQFQWKSTFLPLEDAVNLTQLKNGKLLTFQSLQKHMEELINMYPYSQDSPYVQALKDHPYSKDFFQEHSLILIGLSGKSAVWEVTDVCYADGVLRCSVTGSKYKYQADANSSVYTTVVASGCTYCFVEIDTILPEGTQIEVELREEQLEKSEFYTKRDDFVEKNLY